MVTKMTKELIDRIFKEPGIKYELTEFETLGKPIHEILSIYPKTAETGRDAGRTKYYLKSFIPFSSGNDEIQVYAEGGKSAPEEVVRQLWVYKLIHQYGYHPDEIDLEKSVQFGTEVGTKAADIIVYTDASKETPKIIVECKKPKRKDGIEQLKSYMNAKGAPVAVWSNGSDSIILYRPYPKEFDNTLFDIPKRGQQPKDVLTAQKTLLDLKKEFNFKEIIQGLEELVLADSGKDEFNEIFKLIFAKIWDEKQAQEIRKNKTVEFGQVVNPKTGVPDPDLTYDRVDGLFKKACEEWPGIFRPGEDIELMKRHLQICVGRIEGVRLMGSNLRVMDDAFEYLLPTEAKKKKGQFFTPRHVVEMCVRMLNPKRSEYVMDPACGSAGFLLHTMDWCYPAHDIGARELRKFKYASKYLWGIDFETRAAKTSRALMLIAGDGHTKIFGPDVSSLDPKTWYETGSGQSLMHGLRQAKLTAKKIPEKEYSEDIYEFREPELLMAAERNFTQKELISEAEEKRDALKSELIRVKQKLADLNSDIEAPQQQHCMEIEAITNQWEGTKVDLRAHLKSIRESQKAALKRLKNKQKIKEFTFKAEIKQLEKAIPDAETTVKMLSNKGKLELILADPDLTGALKERWIASEVAKRLDYPIFMAVSERGGKNNSGDYEFLLDENGNLVVNQDLVNYDLIEENLSDAKAIPDDKLCVAEAFVRFAQEQGLDFWEVE